MPDSIEQEERAKLWCWLEFMDLNLESDYIEQLVQIAVQARRVQSVLSVVGRTKQTVLDVARNTNGHKRLLR